MSTVLLAFQLKEDVTPEIFAMKVGGACSRFNALREGETVKVPSMAEHVAAALSGLTPHQRLDVIHSFCVHCGSADPDCQCSNDE